MFPAFLVLIGSHVHRLFLQRTNRELLETIIANLPLEKSSRSSTATRFPFGLLRTAKIFNVSEDWRNASERKIGSDLEQGPLDDLLIPSYSYLNETLYDVDCVERILGYFLDSLHERSVARIEGEEENSGMRSAALKLVGKLMDGYFSEITSDTNLKLENSANLPSRCLNTLGHLTTVFTEAWMSSSRRKSLIGIEVQCAELKTQYGKALKSVNDAQNAEEYNDETSSFRR